MRAETLAGLFGMRELSMHSAGIIAKVEYVRERGFGKTRRRESVPAYLRAASRSGYFTLWAAYSADADLVDGSIPLALEANLDAPDVIRRYPDLADVIRTIPDSSD